MIMDLPYFYELPIIRLPNLKQTACEACPGNLVANATIGVCWCPLGDLIHNNNYDNPNCKHSQFSDFDPICLKLCDLLSFEFHFYQFKIFDSLYGQLLKSTKFPL